MFSVDEGDGYFSIFDKKGNFIQNIFPDEKQHNRPSNSIIDLAYSE